MIVEDRALAARLDLGHRQDFRRSTQPSAPLLAWPDGAHVHLDATVGDQRRRGARRLLAGRDDRRGAALAVGRQPPGLATRPWRPHPRRRRQRRRDHARRLHAHLGARGRATEAAVRASFVDGRELEFEVVGSDPLSDLAVSARGRTRPRARRARRRRAAAGRAARRRDRQSARLRRLGHRRRRLGARPLAADALGRERPRRRQRDPDRRRAQSRELGRGARRRARPRRRDQHRGRGRRPRARRADQHRDAADRRAH